MTPPRAIGPCEWIISGMMWKPDHKTGFLPLRNPQTLVPLIINLPTPSGTPASS